MESKFRSTVIQLQDKSYIHYSKIQKYSKFGYQALFINREKASIFQVHYFSKSLLQINGLLDHFRRSLAKFRTLNFRKITSILEVHQNKEEIYVISPGFQFNLQQLIAKRQGLGQFQAAYFLGQMHQLMEYLKSRQVFIQKIEADDLSLNLQLKLTIGFSLFLNILGEKPIINRLPFRIQYRNRNNCPDLFFKGQILNATIVDVNTWIMGILTYQIIENMLPFPHLKEDFIGRARGLKENQLIDLLNKQYKLSFNETKQYPQLMHLINKLLKPNPVDRVRFQLIIIHAFFKKFPVSPHILPSTVFACPPSESYKEQFFKKFIKEDRMRGNEVTKELRVIKRQQNQRSQKQIINLDCKQGDKYIQSQLQIFSTSNLSDNLVIIEQFADISDSFGYGYQMSTGLIGFVFNDQTQFQYLNGCQQIRCINKGRRRRQTIYSKEKLPQEDQIRKKIYILDAFVKKLKRRKLSPSGREKTIMVSDYCRTKYASLFLLTNNALQVFFNDKMIVYLTKGETYIQQKNAQGLQKYDTQKCDTDLNQRRQYCRTVAQKVFLWQKTEQPSTQIDNQVE